MITIMDLLQDAEQMSLGELRIVSGQKPVFRNKKGWHPLTEEILSPTWVREQLLSVLDEEARVQLLESGCISGLFEYKNKKIFFVISKSIRGFHAHLTWKNELVNLPDFHLPLAVFEILKKSNGLSVISGPRGSGKTTLAQLLAIEISNSGSRAVGIFADQVNEYEIESAKNQDWQIFPTTMISHPQISSGFDFIIIDSHRAATWRQAVQMSEKGIRVLLLLPFPTGRGAVERLAERLEGVGAAPRTRLAEVLQMIISLRLIPGLDKGMQSVYELILMNREIRSAVVREDWEIVEKTMHLMGEKTGMRTLNQCLMNLMLKRKIDLKAGFAESPRPEELDQMLEKVGF